MRKGIVIILAVAIIGALGIYGKAHGNSGSNSLSTNTGSSNNSSASDTSTLGNTTNNSSGGQTSSGSLKDGTYTGNSEDTPYGTVQIAVVVSGGKVSDVNFLQMPNDRGHTQEVTSIAAPLLKQETIGKQNAQIEFVSGATSTSEGYEQSLQSALNQAA